MNGSKTAEVAQYIVSRLHRLGDFGYPGPVSQSVTRGTSGVVGQDIGQPWFVSPDSNMSALCFNIYKVTYKILEDSNPFWRCGWSCRNGRTVRKKGEKVKITN